MSAAIGADRVGLTVNVIATKITENMKGFNA
jgi:hypothetical protein